MVLNSTFDILDTATNPSVNGVWGSACDVDNGEVLVEVLGD